MIKKLIALALVLLMVVPMIASCGPDGDERETSANTQAENQPSGGESNSEFAEVDEHIDELAATHNFSGKTFTWIGGGHQRPETESETGNVENDALYYRQRDIEDKFGITWSNYVPESVEGSDIHATVEAVRTDVLAGSGAYDAGYGTAVAVCQPLFVQDTLADTSEYNTIDLDREWWTQSLRDTYNIAGALYFLNGAIVTSNYQDTYCVLFNKEVAADYDIEDLYSLVNSGEWTFDKMIEIASAVPSNQNDSGAYRFGNPHGVATLIAHDMTITKFDTDGNPYVEDTLSTELSNLADKFSVIYGDDTLTANKKGKLTGSYEHLDEKYGYEEYNEMFEDGKFLFYFATTGDAAYLRELEVEFGILPMPKGSVTQENYVSYAEAWSAFNVFVPKTTKDETVTDVILEAMAALGYKHIKPAYYDKILKNRATHDSESKAMIDIVFATKKYDIIDMLAVGGGDSGDSSFVNAIKGAIQESSDGFASRYLLQARMVSTQIKTILAGIEADR